MGVPGTLAFQGPKLAARVECGPACLAALLLGCLASILLDVQSAGVVYFMPQGTCSIPLGKHFGEKMISCCIHVGNSVQATLTCRMLEILCRQLSHAGMEQRHCPKSFPPEKLQQWMETYLQRKGSWIGTFTKEGPLQNTGPIDRLPGT